MKSEELEKIKKIYEHVSQDDLTEREKQIIAYLRLDQKNTSFETLAAGRYRILQFKTENFTELSKTLKLLLPDFVKADQAEHLVIERFSKENLTKSELFDVFQTLSQDTGEAISAYIGLFTDQIELDEVYREEKAAFENGQSLSEFILSRALENEKSLILMRIRKQLQTHPEDQKLIDALYQTSGNQARAAKLLYVHRNTLLNKIKKYEQRYGLQLLGSDLVLAYNLL